LKAFFEKNCRASLLQHQSPYENENKKAYDQLCCQPTLRNLFDNFEERSERQVQHAKIGLI
jgi:hypothetical protein